MLREQLHKKFLCTNGESCIIDSANRTNCKCCRFAKCLRVGMTLEGTVDCPYTLCVTAGTSLKGTVGCPCTSSELA